MPNTFCFIVWRALIFRVLAKTHDQQRTVILGMSKMNTPQTVRSHRAALFGIWCTLRSLRLPTSSPFFAEHTVFCGYLVGTHLKWIQTPGHDVAPVILHSTSSWASNFPTCVLNSDFVRSGRKFVHLFVAFSSSSVSETPIANVRRLYNFANRAPAPHVSRARRWVPIPHQKRVLEIHGNTSGNFGVCCPRRRFTQSTTSAHMHIAEQK